MPSELKILGISRLRCEELASYIPREEITIAETPISEGLLGEPALLDVILVVTPALLSGFVAYLAATNKSKRRIAEKFELTLPDGTSAHYEITREEVAAADFGPKFIAEIAKLAGQSIDPTE